MSPVSDSSSYVEPKQVQKQAKNRNENRKEVKKPGKVPVLDFSKLIPNDPSLQFYEEEDKNK